MNAAPLVVGVDAGGSTVSALARVGGRLVGKGEAGRANPLTAGFEVAAEAIAEAVLEAAGRSGHIKSLYVGAAGAGSEGVAVALARALRARLTNVEALIVEDDARIALRAAVREGPGVVVIAGTGSVAYAEREGVRVRVGGAGYLLGDEGSAFSVGMAAVRALARVYDGRERASSTSRAVESALNVASREALLERVYRQARSGGLNVPVIAALAPKVIAFAKESDATAGGIVQAAARDLARLASDASRCAQLEAPKVVLAGGLLRVPSMLTELLTDALKEALPACEITVLDEDPALAAARLAEAALSPEPS